jgi:hypothetical protein
MQRVVEKKRECLDNSVENNGGSYSIILKLQPFFRKYRMEDLKKRSRLGGIFFYNNLEYIW